MPPLFPCVWCGTRNYIGVKRCEKCKHHPEKFPGDCDCEQCHGLFNVGPLVEAYLANLDRNGDGKPPA